MIGFYGISTIVGYLIPSPLYMYILNLNDLVWLGFDCWLFNTKSFSYIYIYILDTWDLVWLMVYQPNTVFIYIKYMICRHFVDTFLNERELIFFAHRLLQVFLWNSNNLTRYLFAQIWIGIHDMICKKLVGR